MDFDYKFHFKFDGLNHSLPFEQDKCDIQFDKMLHQKQMMDQLAKERNKVFDPSYMEINLPQLPNTNCSGISFDPDFMIFDIKP